MSWESGRKKGREGLQRLSEYWKRASVKLLPGKWGEDGGG